MLDKLSSSAQEDLYVSMCLACPAFEGSSSKGYRQVIDAKTGFDRLAYRATGNWQKRDKRWLKTTYNHSKAELVLGQEGHRS